MIVPRSANAVNGLLYWAPSHSATPTPITNCTKTATCGDRYLGWVRPSIAGSRWILPIANQVLVAALEPALEFAIAEFAIARNTSTQPAPHAARASASQGFPSPEAGKSKKRLGPKYTTAAYVVST